MTIIRQNGCFVPFYTIGVSPSMFNHSRFILLGFLVIHLMFFETIERFRPVSPSKPDYIHKECNYAIRLKERKTKQPFWGLIFISSLSK